MGKKHLNSWNYAVRMITLIFLLLPIFSFAQESMQRAIETAPRAINQESVSGGAAIAAPAATIVATPIPTPTPPQTSTPTHKPTSTASPSPKLSKPVFSPAAPLPQNDTTQNAENNNGTLYVILTAFGLAGFAYGASRFFKQNAKQKNDDRNEKENKNCDSIKSLLDYKIKEMEESVKNWPKEKIEKTIKEYAINRLLNEQEKTLLKQAEVAKEKYDKLKEAIEMLQGKYDLCKLGLKIGNTKTLKFRDFKAEMILKGEKTASLRLFDDKNLRSGDILELINFDTGKQFASAKITEVIEKKLGEINERDLVGHEPLDGGILQSLKKYYGDKITMETCAKIVRFKLCQ